MSDENDALDRANKFLAVIPGRAVARINNDDIAALLKEAEEATRPKEPPRPIETKQQAPKIKAEPLREAPSNPVPVVKQPEQTVVVQQPQSPAATAEVLPPVAVPAGQENGNGQNTNVVVNVTMPAMPAHPWWGYWGPAPYYPHAYCPARGCTRPYLHPCGNWFCPNK